MKKPQANIRLRLPANKAAPSPILGQALGQYGINMMNFCKEFNNKTKNIKENTIIPTKVKIFNHNHFEIQIKLPSTTSLFKSAAKFTKGSTKPKKQNLQNNEISLKELYHIAIFKKCDPLMSHLSLKSICKTLIGTTKSMGLPIVRSENN